MRCDGAMEVLIGADLDTKRGLIPDLFLPTPRLFHRDVQHGLYGPQPRLDQELRLRVLSWSSYKVVDT